MGSNQELSTWLHMLSGDRCNDHQKPDPPMNPPVQNATNPLVQGGRSIRIVLQTWSPAASFGYNAVPGSYRVLDVALGVGRPRTSPT
jgi:hypothetical protein